MQETLAGTVLLKWDQCPIFVAVCAALKNHGKHGTAECADAGNTGRDGTFEMVYMSDCCRGLRAGGGTPNPKTLKP